jgi:hypothetical protein
MNLIRLKRHQHPRPPQRELRQHNVLDSRGRFVGEVANLYVDDDRELHFVDVVTRGFLGLGKKHYLVPVEVITDETPGAITLGVEQETVERAPTFPNPLAGPDEELQRAIWEHYVYG